MDLESLWAQIEQEQTWRTDEVRFFDNLVSKVAEDNKDRFRRANVLLLYAHYEGFCKFAFTMYIDAINGEGLDCLNVNYALAAAAMNTVFRELRNPDAKATEFKATAPDDKKLHLFARDREFLEKISNFENRRISIPETVVDTESNLKPAVLRKNLYRLGFQHDSLEFLEGYIHMLLQTRNEIAHGAHGIGVAEGKYERVRDVTFEVMSHVKRFVMTALMKKDYLRAS
ncbi:MAG: MAE_28990/MAE_18760 family HEPN-like nuclease [Bacteroidota bacterium]